MYGRPELFEARGDFRLRALTVERFGLGEHLAALERLKRKLADEGLFAAERKRPLPRLPRRIGLVTGNDAAAKRDVISSITARFPPARILIAETYVQGPRAAGAVVDALRAICDAPEIDVVVLARGGGSFQDLLPFSDERLVRAIAECAVPVVSAIGHEQDTPLWTSSPMCAPPRRPRPRGSSFPTRRSCSPASTALARRWLAARRARSSASADASTPPATTSARPRC